VSSGGKPSLKDTSTTVPRTAVTLPCINRSALGPSADIDPSYSGNLQDNFHAPV
jgi:hypothetical protein